MEELVGLKKNITRLAEKSRGEVVVSVKNVSKKFCKKLRRSMAYGIVDLSKNLCGIRSDSSELRKDEFWAIEDINLELRKGEVLGLIGINGSGKSTLLRLLAGIFPPDKGEISIKGKVGALIAVGTGFHPHMTGRENIYLNGTILGMSKKEIDSKFEEIVDFAEIGDFLDAPVSTYSSGMRVRLGFSIAVHIEPDLLLIDEVLAVGDIGFRAKCFNAIANITKNAAVIFVSHAMPQVARICTDVCVLNKGKAVFLENDVPKGIDYYYSYFKTEKGVVTGNGRATIHKFELESKGKMGVKQINYLDDLSVHLDITVDPEVKYPVINISFLNRELQIIAQSNSLFNGVQVHNTGEPLHITIKIPRMNFNPGIYMLSALVLNENRHELLIHHHAVKELKVSGEFVGFAPVQLVGGWEVRH